MTQTEFDAILSDETKRIAGDLFWKEDEDHSPSVEFRAEVESDSGWPLVLCGSYNSWAGTLTYAVIHRGEGRIYALDLGKDHRNPRGEFVGEKHKHRWTEQFRDKHAYVPTDITAVASQPLDVWRQFCMEARIRHDGTLHAPPAAQGIL